MTARRKPAAPPVAGLGAADLAAFLKLPADASIAPEALDGALATARRAAEEFAGHPLPELLNHNYRQGVLLTAAQVLLAGGTKDDLKAADAPATARYHWTLGAAG